MGGFIKIFNIKNSNRGFSAEIFQNRSDFLSLCQGNRYQFDSIRRAKHSTMMVLYHLHHSEEPAFVSTCNICGNRTELRMAMSNMRRLRFMYRVLLQKLS